MSSSQDFAATASIFAASSRTGFLTSVREDSTFLRIPLMNEIACVAAVILSPSVTVAICFALSRALAFCMWKSAVSAISTSEKLRTTRGAAVILFALLPLLESRDNLVVPILHDALESCGW